MPLTFEALKAQRFRWCFGGVQLLRRHWRSLLPWDRDPDNRLSGSQRMAYLSGGLQWMGDLLGLVFLLFLFVAAGNVALGGVLIVRRLSPLLLVVVPALALLGIVRAVGGIRRAAGAPWREAIGALGIWLALSVTVARACARGAIEPAGVFLRTPKTRSRTSLRESMRMNWLETALGTCGLVAAFLVAAHPRLPNAWLIAALLVVSAAGYLAAPLNSLAALRADLPERLRRRRATEIARAWTRLANSAPRGRIGLATLTLGAAVATVVLLAPTLASDSTPTLGPREQHDGVAAGPTDRKPHAATSTTRAGPGSPSNRPPTTGISTPVSAPPNATPSGVATTTGPPDPRPATSSDAAPTTPVATSATPSGATAPSTSARTIPAPPTTPARTITNPPAPTSPTNRPTTTPSPSHSHTAS
jgi:hypothetical protein